MKSPAPSDILDPVAMREFLRRPISGDRVRILSGEHRGETGDVAEIDGRWARINLWGARFWCPVTELEVQND